MDTTEAEAVLIWSKAKDAAERIAGAGLHPELLLGATLPVPLVEAIAREAGVQTESTLYVDAPESEAPYVITSVEKRHCGVLIRGQGCRPATDADRVLRRHRCGTGGVSLPPEVSHAS